jgi:transcriptional regulator GlxA family with amidase domain
MGDVMEKPMLSVNEVAALTTWSRRTVVRVFARERGVVALRKPGGKRRTLRIPKPVYMRVMAKLTVR